MLEILYHQPGHYESVTTWTPISEAQDDKISRSGMFRRLRRGLRGYSKLCLMGVVCILLLLWQENRLMEETGSRIDRKVKQEYSPLELCHGWLEDKPLRSTVKETLDIFRTLLVPTTFMSNYTSPCWYSVTDNQLSTAIDKTINQRIRDTIPKMDTYYSAQEAEKLIKMAGRGANEVDVTRRLFCLPSFYQAGFQKCGTTALYNMIVSHPLLAEPQQKEGHFWREFSKPWMSHEHRALQVLHYLFHINPASEMIKRNPKMLTVDASTSTITIGTHREITDDRETCIRPLVLSQLIPSVKIIVIMRNPSDQLWSDYWFFCATERWTVNKVRTIPQKYEDYGPEIFHNHTMAVLRAFNNCIDRAESPVLECVRKASVGKVDKYDCQYSRVGIALYYYHLIPWLSSLPREQFLFLRSEDLSNEPLQEIVKVWPFLQLEPISADWLRIPENSWSTNSWITSGRYREKFQMLAKTRTALEEFYRPHNQKLAELLKDNRFLWKDLS